MPQGIVKKDTEQPASKWWGLTAGYDQGKDKESPP